MNKLFSKVFGWLSIGLFISFLAAYLSSINTSTLKMLYSSNYIVLIVIELIVAFVLGLCIRKLSKPMTILLYIIYCIITGLTMSYIFIIYTKSSVAFIFLITSAVFAGLSIYGYKTQKDITKLGNILFFGIILILISYLINIFVKSASFDIGICIISVIIFTLYIAFDIQKLKRYIYDIDEDKLAVYGAFQLYLDFINLFIDLLRLFGVKKRD